MTYDFNDLATMLRSGASDEELAKAFTENLNMARASEAKRKAEEEKKAAAEAAKTEADKARQAESKRLAAEASAAVNAFLVHEGILHEGESCFSTEDFIEFVNDTKEEINALMSLLKPLESLASTTKSSRTKSISDDKIFDELFSKIF